MPCKHCGKGVIAKRHEIGGGKKKVCARCVAQHGYGRKISLVLFGQAVSADDVALIRDCSVDAVRKLACLGLSAGEIVAKPVFSGGARKQKSPP